MPKLPHQLNGLAHDVPDPQLFVPGHADRRSRTPLANAPGLADLELMGQALLGPAERTPSAAKPSQARGQKCVSPGAPSRRSPAVRNGDQTSTGKRREASPQDQAQAFGRSHAAAVLAELSRSHYPTLPAAVFQAHRDAVVAASADPADPFQQMLSVQLLWAHHRIGHLHVEAMNATTPELADALNAAVVRLSGEFRRGALALHELRHPAPAAQVMVVGQQNVGANQQIALVESPAAAHPSGEMTLDGELVSNEPPRLTQDVHERIITESTTSGRREVEPCPAERLDGARPPAASRVGAQAPPLAAIDGADDGSR